MSFDFPIPLTRDDLTRRTGVNQYIVDEVLPVRQLPAKLQGESTKVTGLSLKCMTLANIACVVFVLCSLQLFHDVIKLVSECKATYRSQGPVAILNVFDTFYSILRRVLFRVEHFLRGSV